MDLATRQELYNNRFLDKLGVKRIVSEQTVLLEPHNGNSIRKGRFDFLVLTDANKTIGFEVLTRPSHGKMSKKLSYAKEVDEFVFVIPSNSFELYRKNSSNGFHRVSRPKFFSPSFDTPRLSVWLVNPKNGQVEEKSVFSKVFNTQKSKQA